MALSLGLAKVATGATATLTTTSGTSTAGSTFVALVMGDGAATGVPSDNKGNTFVEWGSQQYLIGYGAGHGKVFRCENAAGGAGHTFTVTNGSAYGALIVLEVKGAAAASFDVSAQTRDSSSPYTVTTPTTSQADEIVVALLGFTGTGGDGVTTESTGFTVAAEQRNWDYMQAAAAYKVVSAVGAFTPSFSITNSSDAALWIATFKAAAGATDYPLAANSGSFALTGADAGLLGSRVLTSGAGSFALTGSDATLTYTPLSSYSLAAGAGSYALTGASAGLVAARSVSAATGAFALTGGATTRIVARKLVAASRALVLSGKVATLKAARTVAADAGSYALTGADATLVYSPVGSYTLVADSGGFALTGSEAVLTLEGSPTTTAGAAPRRRRYEVEYEGEIARFDTLEEARAYLAARMAEFEAIPAKRRRKPAKVVRTDLARDVPDYVAKPVLRRVRGPVYVSPPDQVVRAMKLRAIEREDEEILLLMARL